MSIIISAFLMITGLFVVIRSKGATYHTTLVYDKMDKILSIVGWCLMVLGLVLILIRAVSTFF